MPSAGVVEELDVAEHVGSGIVADAADFAGCAIDLLRGKEALDR